MIVLSFKKRKANLKFFLTISQWHLNFADQFESSPSHTFKLLNLGKERYYTVTNILDLLVVDLAPSL